MHFNQRRRQRVESSSTVPDWLGRTRDETVLQYDPKHYRLDILVADLIGVRPMDLARLHRISLDECRWPLHPMLQRAFKRAKLHRRLLGLRNIV